MSTIFQSHTLPTLATTYTEEYYKLHHKNYNAILDFNAIEEKIPSSFSLSQHFTPPIMYKEYYTNKVHLIGH